MRIRNKNSIFAYYEIIEKLEPTSILDIGMLLKRTGSVSRQLMNRKIPEEILLDGIDVFPEVSFDAWKNIYNRIFTWQEFLSETNEKQYDLVVILESEALKKHLDINELFLKIGSCCHYFLLDSLANIHIEGMADKKVQNVKVGGDVYYFIDNSQ